MMMWFVVGDFDYVYLFVFFRVVVGEVEYNGSLEGFVCCL